ncbi:hypothetical protein LINGRAHAP2_LOCUS33839, partial [Linum grandiflorum]
MANATVPSVQWRILSPTKASARHTSAWLLTWKQTCNFNVRRQGIQWRILSPAKASAPQTTAWLFTRKQTCSVNV